MLKIENLNFQVKNFFLKDINLEIAEKEYFLLLGPTGSGKTLFLRCVMGLEKYRGKISFQGRGLDSLATEERGIGYLPQNYLLFPHLSVRENILFALEVKNLAETERRLAEIAELLGIEDLLKRQVERLSGGEKQRVALARTLIAQPRLLLLDEPFAAIDVGLKHYLWFELKKILTRLGTTVIQVTHDIEEAMTLADRVAVMFAGKIYQWGFPSEILLHPASLAVVQYLGIKNVFAGKIVAEEKSQLIVNCSGLNFFVPGYPGFSVGQKVFVVIRPQSVKIIKEDVPVRPELKNNIFVGQIVENYFYSDTVSIFVRVGEIVLELKFPTVIYHRYKLCLGKTLKIAPWQPDILLYPGNF